MRVLILIALLLAACGKRAEPPAFEYLEDAQRKCWRIANTEAISSYALWQCEAKR